MLYGLVVLAVGEFGVSPDLKDLRLIFGGVQGAGLIDEDAN